MRADTDAVLEAFGKNEQVKKVFWTFFIATAGLVLAQVLDPAAAGKIAGTLAGIVPKGGYSDYPPAIFLDPPAVRSVSSFIK